MEPPATGFNREQLLRAYEFNLKYAQDLVGDISENLLYHSPGPGLENHPGFTLGHLVMASALMVKYLGEAYDIPDGWEDLFHRTGPGDPRRPVTDADGLPSKSSLLMELDRLHGLLESKIRSMSADEFCAAVEWRFDSQFPTVGDMLTFLCITHEAMHLSQVAAWRRAMGLESSLARL